MKRILSLFLIFVTILSLIGCAVKPVSDNADTINITDSLNNTLTVPKQPKRVAVLLSSFADVWICAGGTVSITVGESVERNIVSEDVLLVDDGAGKTIDTERLIAAKPDFVICSADIQAQVNTAKLCNEAGIPAGIFRVECFEDYLSVLSVFTQITERSDCYEANGGKIAEKVEFQMQSLKRTDAAILFIRAGSTARSTKAKTASEHFACQMLDQLGTHNIADSAPILLDGLSFEEILMQDPDYIFITTMGNENAAKEYMQSVLSDPQWQQLSAVRNEKVFFLPKALFQYKPNAKWAEAYEYLINILNS